MGVSLRLVVVSGLSGAGKSVAMNALEDLGYYCVDNLPTSLLSAFAAELEGAAQPMYHRSAVGIDARSPPETLAQFPATIRDLRDRGVISDLLFLEADEDILIKRFSETRRKHPLSAANLSLAEAIRREMELMAPLRLLADIRLDTTRTNLHELREIIRRRIDKRRPGTLSLLFVSFGFKHGIPADADMVYDARCLPNPHWEPALRKLTGKDRPVVEFLEAQPLVGEMVRDLTSFLESWVPRFEAENRAYLTVAIGCTGGQHRSVYLVEKLVGHFRVRRHEQVLARHRELPA